jgi:hypothetical protein
MSVILSIQEKEISKITVGSQQKVLETPAQPMNSVVTHACHPSYVEKHK